MKLNRISILELINPKRQYIIFSFIVISFYGAIPLALYFKTQEISFLECSLAGLLSSICIFLGGNFVKKRVVHFVIKDKSQKINNLVVFSLILFFIAFITTAIFTATSIPILVSFNGGSIEEISISRAMFLKARDGIYSILVYVSALLSGFIIPYVLAKLYLSKSKTFWFLLIIFSSYSVISTEKAFFMRWAIPLLVLFYMIGRSGSKKYITIAKRTLFSIFLIIFINITLSGFSDGKGFNIQSTTDFFNAGYASEVLNQNGAMFFIWRTFAVPIFTASDSFKTFNEVYEGQLLWGATNGTLSSLFGLNRVWFERDVFAGQWGQADGGTMSSNAVYFTEAFVNFGWLGLIIISLLVGYILAKMGNSKDIGINILTPLLTYNLFSSGLLGTLLGNGLLLLFVLLFIVNKTDKHHKNNNPLYQHPILTIKNH